MSGELNEDRGIDALLARARLAQPVDVTVVVYRLSRLAVIHDRRCSCRIYPVPAGRQVQYRTATSLPALLMDVWPDDFLMEGGYEATVRAQARRACLAPCQPPIIIPPTLRPLMRQEPPLPEIHVMVCPDATGKQIVHDPHCDHAARQRASKEKTGSAFLVTSLHALVPLALPNFPGNVEEVAASEFEVRDCVRNLPTTDPTPVPLATKLAVARKRAYSALVALYTTAQTIDGERARGAAQRLEQRLATTSERRRQGANLRVPDVWEHLVAASEAACWAGVRQSAEDPDAAGPGYWQSLDDQGKADRWVKAALEARERYRVQEERGREDGGTVMGRAFAEAEAAGRLAFRQQVSQALTEVDELRRRAADAAG